MTLQSILDSKIRIQYAPRDLRATITDELTVPNPKYAKARAMGFSTYNIPRMIKLYEHIGNGIVLPRGYLNRLLQIAPDAEVTDHRLTLPAAGFTSKIELRDYQAPVIPAAIKAQQGVIVAPCGSGKTEMGMEFVARVDQPTLWLTHTKDLANQSRDRAVSRLGLSKKEIGFIGGDTFRVGQRFTVGMVPTLAKRNLLDLTSQFGCIVIDECHHVFKDAKSVGTFQKVISSFPARYRIGLTATPHRSDGLVETMFYVLGPKIIEVEQGALKDAGQVIAPTVRFIETGWEFEYREDFNELLGAMVEDAERNQLLLDVLAGHVEGHHSLILGDRISHLQEILNRVVNLKPGMTNRTAIVTGETPKAWREKIMQDTRSGKIQVLFATYALAKEGLDIPILDQLFLVTPKRDYAVVTQAVGRIARPADGKTSATVFDFYDSEVGVLIGQAVARRNKVYKPLQCKIINPPVSRKQRELKLQQALQDAFRN